MPLSESVTAEFPSFHSEQLAYLRGVDSPYLQCHRGVQGSALDAEGTSSGGAIRDLSTELGVRSVRAAVMMTSVPGAVDSLDGTGAVGGVEREPKPAVMVVHDVSGAPLRCAYWGG